MDTRAEHEAALFAAIAAGDLDAVARALDAGASIEAENGPHRDTPLRAAVRAGSRPLVTLMLDRGADVRARNFAQYTAAHVAVSSPISAGAATILALLLDRGADPSAGANNGMRPLSLAVCTQAIDAAKLLIERGVDVNVTDIWGATVLHHAAIHGPSELIELILSRGADRTIKTSKELPYGSKKKLAKGSTPHAIAKTLARKWVALLAVPKASKAVEPTDEIDAVLRDLFGATPPEAVRALYRAHDAGETHFSTMTYGGLALAQSARDVMPGFGGAVFFAKSEDGRSLGLYRYRQDMDWADTPVVWSCVEGELFVAAPRLEELFVLRASRADEAGALGGRKVTQHQKQLAKASKACGMPSVSRKPDAILAELTALCAELSRRDDIDVRAEIDE